MRRLVHARSGALSLAFGTFPFSLHGYCVISSEWASTVTVTVRSCERAFVSLSLISAPRRPSGATSVRRRRMPSIDGSS